MQDYRSGKQLCQAKDNERVRLTCDGVSAIPSVHCTVFFRVHLTYRIVGAQSTNPEQAKL